MIRSRTFPIYQLVVVIALQVLVPTATISRSQEELNVDSEVMSPRCPTTPNGQLPSNSAPFSRDLPNALANWGEIKQRIANRPVAVFLDYDGTLSHHVPDPEKATISDEMRSVLKTLSTQYKVSIITGRPMETIRRFLKGMDNVFYAASHGLDIAFSAKAGGNDRLIVGEEYQPYLLKSYNELQGSIGHIKGCILENNGLSVSVHYRNVENEENGAENRGLIEKAVDDILKKYAPNLRKINGEKVYELRPNMDWDKGKAVRHILQHKFKDSSTISVYLGDDTTDEDAFKVVRDIQGIAILVNKKKKETAAEYVVGDPDDVLQVLKLLSGMASEQDLSRRLN